MLRKIHMMVLMLAVLSTGCLAFNRQAFDKNAAAHIRTVAVTQRTDPITYQIIVLHHTGSDFGLIGSAVALDDVRTKAKRLTTALVAAETNLQKNLATKLAGQLAESGYQVETIKAAVAAPAAPFSSDDEKLFEQLRPQLKQEALISLSVDGGYIAADLSSGYRPFVRVHALVNEVSTGKLLYEERFYYGNLSGPIKGLVAIHGGDKYRFESVDDLVNNAAKARDGLLEGLDAIAARLASDLKK